MNWVFIKDNVNIVQKTTHSLWETPEQKYDKWIQGRAQGTSELMHS